MRTIHWVALVGSIAAALIACSSEDDGNDPIGPGKGGSGGGVIGKGGAAGGTSKGGATNNGGTTNNGGAENQGGATNQGGAENQGGAAGSGPCDMNTQVQSDACQSDCLPNACGAEKGACQQSQACGDLATCIEGCAQGDTACETKCATDNPDGQQPYFAFYGCLYATCHDDCFCPGSCLFGSEGACNDCLAGSCGNECNGCDKDATCMSMMQCIWGVGCYDLATDAEIQACMDGCAQKFNGVAALNAFNTCGNEKCATACQ